jgi:hypothetical protein
MPDAAEQACMIYDPYERLGAAHAAMFARPNVKNSTSLTLGLIEVCVDKDGNSQTATFDCR